LFFRHQRGHDTGRVDDAGLDLHQLESELSKLKIAGYTLKAEMTTRQGISGTKFSVDADEDHVERHLRETLKKLLIIVILTMILKPPARKSSMLWLSLKQRSIIVSPQRYIFMRSRCRFHH